MQRWGALLVCCILTTRSTIYSICVQYFTGRDIVEGVLVWGICSYIHMHVLRSLARPSIRCSQCCSIHQMLHRCCESRKNEDS